MHFVNLKSSLSLGLFYPYTTVSKSIIALPFYPPLQGRNLGIRINDKLPVKLNQKVQSPSSLQKMFFCTYLKNYVPARY
jgi:hypothetical protein